MRLACALGLPEGCWGSRSVKEGSGTKGVLGSGLVWMGGGTVGWVYHECRRYCREPISEVLEALAFGLPAAGKCTFEITGLWFSVEGC